MTCRPRFASYALVGVLILAMAGCNDDDDTPAPAGDTTAPTVSSTSPANASTGVARVGALTATFSEAVDGTTVTDATFTVTDSGGHAVAGTVTASGNTATFTPSSDLSYLTTYTATLTTGIKDAAGNPMGASRSWSFTTITTPSPVLDVATLKGWVDNGQVNRAGKDKVVVLDIGSSGYATAHIPGAQFVKNTSQLDSDIFRTRQEGPAAVVGMVLDGAAMDALVKSRGIDADTTVVVTLTGGILNATRTYWMFRYWGFPKEKLKVLNGLNGAWTAAGYPTSAEAPVVTASTYSVAGNTLRRDLRASLTEMMAVAQDNDANTVILDGRSAETAGSYSGATGKTGGVFLPGSDFVVFEGHMRGARALDYLGMFNSDNTFKSAADLTTLFGTVGITATTTTYPHCRTGVIASMPFFALDAILGWDAVLYDASWSQWGQLSADSANGGQLTAESPWRTDIAALSDLVAYNHPASAVEILTVDGLACSGTLATTGGYTWSGAAACTNVPDSALPLAEGDQVEVADAAYTSVTTD